MVSRYPALGRLNVRGVRGHDGVAASVFAGPLVHKCVVLMQYVIALTTVGDGAAFRKAGSNQCA